MPPPPEIACHPTKRPCNPIMYFSPALPDLVLDNYLGLLEKEIYRIPAGVMHFPVVLCFMYRVRDENVINVIFLLLSSNNNITVILQ